MEITKHLLFICVLHLSAFYSHVNVTSVKRKKISAKPHGRHVANKRGRSTLFDTHGVNQTLPNVLPVVVVSMKGSLQEEEEARMTSVHYPGEKIRDDKKRRRKRRKHNMRKLMKKMQDDTKSLSRVGHHQPYPKRTCRNWSECKKDECCIRHSSTKGFCKRRPQKGHRCKPILLPGLRDCPCDQGLTCTRYKTTKWGIKKHRCELLKQPEDEVDQRYI